MLRRATTAVTLVAGLSLAQAQPAGAHGLGSRTDLPLPLWMFTYGAAAALLISFAGLAVFWRSARLEGGGVGRVVLKPGPLSRGLAFAGRVEAVTRCGAVCTGHQCSVLVVPQRAGVEAAPSRHLGDLEG